MVSRKKEKKEKQTNIKTTGYQTFQEIFHSLLQGGIFVFGLGLPIFKTCFGLQVDMRRHYENSSFLLSLLGCLEL